MQWEPTLEPVDLKDYAVGKYRPLSVSARVYLVDGELRRRVVWRSSWEPSRSVGVSVSGESVETVRSRVKRVEFLDDDGLAPGWHLRMSARHNNLYFYCPEKDESSWEVPEGTSFEVAMLCLEMQRKMCVENGKTNGNTSGVMEKS